jgi:phenylalanyl-tRNA synthetase beta chain
MLIPVEWLTEYVTIDEEPAALAERLTMAGLEVEESHGEGEALTFNLKITPNRGDWLSVVGVAREVAALTGAELRAPPPAVAGGAPQPGLSVEIEAPDLCPRYVARFIRHVRWGPSPDWMQRRLTLAGLRPISSVVDVTNYVMLELGQPLHAFDFDLLAEGRIVVRRARPGELLLAIDGTKVQLEPDMLVIADARRPVALAGVMGGAETEVSPRTRHVLLESAHFNPASVRRTSRRAGLASASSYRFERTVDPAGVRAAADRAAQLLAALAGGEVSETVVDVYPAPIEPPRIRFRPARARALLGVEIPDAEMQQSLHRLGVAVATPDSPAGNPAPLDGWTARPPSWRSDLAIEEDLIEEVARLHGYAALPAPLPGGIAAPGRTSQLHDVTGQLRAVFLAQGCFEAATSSLLARREIETSGFTASPAWPGVEAQPITVRNPLSEEYDTLRPSLLPGLLAALRWNLRHGVANAFLFETGWAHVRRAGEAGGAVPETRLLAAAVLHGSRWADIWNPPPAAADFYTARGIVEELASALRLPPLAVAAGGGPGLHPGRSARFLLNGAVIAAAGELHPEVSARIDLPRGVYALECDVDALLAARRPAGRYEAPSRFPLALRDLAILVATSVTAAQVEAVLRAELGDWLRGLRVFDVYRGKPLPEDQVSLAFALRLGLPDRTLTDDEVDARLARARERLRAELGAELRGQ